MSARAVTSGQITVMTATAMPASPSRTSGHHSRRAWARRIAITIAMIPSTAMYAANRITSANTVAPGSTSARIPNRTANTPRTTSTHQFRARVSIGLLDDDRADHALGLVVLAYEAVRSRLHAQVLQGVGLLVLAGLDVDVHALIRHREVVQRVPGVRQVEGLGRGHREAGRVEERVLHRERCRGAFRGRDLGAVLWSYVALEGGRRRLRLGLLPAGQAEQRQDQREWDGSPHDARSLPSSPRWQTEHLTCRIRFGAVSAKGPDVDAPQDEDSSRHQREPHRLVE